MAPYGSETGVEGINAHMSGGYTTATSPSSSEVATFLAQGAAHIDAALARAGCVTPVAATATCLPLIVRLNDLYAAACAEQAVNISTAGPGEETRSAVLWQQYRQELKDLLSGDPTAVGLTLSAAGSTTRRRVRSLPLRHQDGYAERADEVGAEYSHGGAHIIYIGDMT